MSNHLAIATVTEGLHYIVENALSEVGSGAQVTLTRPDLSANESATHVNIYLYHVTPNAAWRNADLPTRRSDGSNVQRPTAALDLHYVISFHGDETEGEIEAQRLLGAVVSALHTRPLLTREVLEDVLAGTQFAVLLDSNLADQVEMVRITPANLTLDELSKLWSVFFQTPYILSLAYQCSVVLIESTVTPEQSLPVRTAGIRAVPFVRAIISEIINNDGKELPITNESTIRINGSSLNGENVVVRIGEVEAEPARLTDREATVDLTDAGALDITALRAGVIPVQLVYRVAMDPDDPIDSLRVGWTSNVAPLILRPRIDIASTQQGDVDGVPHLEVALIPDVDPRQRATLLLNPAPGENLRSYVIDAPPRTGTTPSDVISFPIPGVEAGDYLIRVQIGGAESSLEIDGNGTYNGPQFTITV